MDEFKLFPTNTILVMKEKKIVEITNIAKTKQERST
jgi:hypothetical protein